MEEADFRNLLTEFNGDPQLQNYNIGMEAAKKNIFLLALRPNPPLSPRA